MARGTLSRQTLRAFRRLVGTPPDAGSAGSEPPDAEAAGDPVAQEPALAPPGPPLAPPAPLNENPDPLYAAVEEALRARGHLRD